jgi:hypothetical protein
VSTFVHGDFQEVPLPAAFYRFGNIKGSAVCDPPFDLVQPSSAAQPHEFFRIICDSIAVHVTHPQ